MTFNNINNNYNEIEVNSSENKIECELCSIKTNNKTNNYKSKRIALIGITFFGSVSITLLSICLPFIFPAFRPIVLPFIPATDSQISNILKIVKKSKPSTLIDLGSGDGRIVIECAKIGINSYGVELNPWLVLYSKISSRLSGIHRFAHFERKDLWKVNTSNYDNIVIFGVENMMSLLENKILKDCDKSGNSVTVIACRFPLPNWKPIEVFGSGIDTVWKYKYPLLANQ